LFIVVLRNVKQITALSHFFAIIKTLGKNIRVMQNLLKTVNIMILRANSFERE